MRFTKGWTVLRIVLFAVFGQMVHGQTPYFGPTKIIVSLDPNTDVPETELPFDRWFYIRKYVIDKGLNSAILTGFTLTEISSLSSNGLIIDLSNRISQAPESDRKGYLAFDILVSPIPPSNYRNFTFQFITNTLQLALYAEILIELHKGNGDQNNQAKAILKEINDEKVRRNDNFKLFMSDLKSYYEQRAKSLLTQISQTLSYKKKIDTLIQLMKDQPTAKIKDMGSGNIEEIELFNDERIIDNAATLIPNTLEMRLSYKIQPEIGLTIFGFGGSRWIGVNEDFFGVTPYVGANIMLRPFDGDIPIRKLKKIPDPYGDFSVKPLQRLSIHVGLSLRSLAKDNYRKNLLDPFNPMVGIGYRISNTIKIQSGILFYRKIDPNPIIDSHKPGYIGYITLAFDFRIQKALGDVGTLIFGK